MNLLRQIGQQGHVAIEQGLSQANAIEVPLESKLQKELPVMAAVGEVIGKARRVFSQEYEPTEGGSKG